MTLQTFDGIVKSIQETRKVFSIMTDKEFAAWYSRRYQITERRVIAILEALKEEEAK
ncbi:hypothetical protein [Paenibacillus rigui]|uniref:hypothetical protein n=1 Tax=Paenibacillus rigui TaxID=554312 RepID=UPI0015C5932D|nr:hypothetical protein [Paenibacillus rigui]